MDDARAASIMNSLGKGNFGDVGVDVPDDDEVSDFMSRVEEANRLIKGMQEGNTGGSHLTWNLWHVQKVCNFCKVLEELAALADDAEAWAAMGLTTA